MMDIQKNIAEKIAEQHRTPLEQFDGNSPDQIYNMLYHPFSET